MNSMMPPKWMAPTDGAFTATSPFPLLRPTAAFIIVIATIGALQVFGSIFILTGGGPVNATTTVVYQIYNEAFNFGRFGYASALSILFFAIILIIALIQSRYLRFGDDVY